VARKALAAADAGASAGDVLRLAAVVDIRRARQTIGAADSADVERLCSAFERECDALVATAGAVS